MFSSRIFLILCFIFRLVIHFELIFVYGMRYGLWLLFASETPYRSNISSISYCIMLFKKIIQLVIFRPFKYDYWYRLKPIILLLHFLIGPACCFYFPLFCLILDQLSIFRITFCLLCWIISLNYLFENFITA